jgi:Xaa-Pro dipeptidase
VKISRRKLLQSGAAVAGMAATASLRAKAAEQEQKALPGAFDGLKPPGDKVKPITTEEFKARCDKAQRLLGESKVKNSVLMVTPTSSLYYFTGIHWWPSERILALLIPASGEPLLVCPAFEEGRLREQLRWPMEVRVWQEDESPYEVGAKWLAERPSGTSAVAVEQETPYIFFEGLRKAYPHAEYSLGNAITVSCRAQKSGAELALMRLACWATFEVYKAVFASVREGMKQSEVGDMVTAGFAKMNLPGDALVLFGRGAALPHGTREDLALHEGDGILIDGGTVLEGYHSDITRTTSLGKPSDKLKRAFEVVRGAQDAALAACTPGHACGSVDDAARAVIVNAGFGPGYKYMGHRLGHGIGLEEHEDPYLVRRNPVILAERMTFSNEPGIYVRGEYGLRCEDDMVASAEGPAKLLTPYFAVSLEEPFRKD